MKKLLLFLAVLLTCNILIAQDEENEKLYSAAFEKDHEDFKDARTTVKLWKRMNKMYPGYYEEKNTFKPSAEDTANGYSIFMVPCAQDIYPNTRPGKDDMKKDLSGFAIPGTYTPIVLCVLPTNDTPGISVLVSDLKGPAGSITSKDITVHHIKYEYVPVGVTWLVKSRYLMKGPADGLANIPRPFWITVKVPENTAAGIYKGEVTVNAGKKPTKLPISIEVFPFTFAPWQELHTYWMWYYRGYPEKELDRDMANLKEHGMNCFDSGNPFTAKVSGGSVSVDFTLADKVVPLLKKYGFTKWMFDTTIQSDLCRQTGGQPWSAAHKAALKEYSRIIAEKAKGANWPKLVFTFDEPREDNEASNLRGFIDMQNTFQIMGEAGLITNPSWTGGGIGEGKRKDDSSKICDYRDLCNLPFFNTTHAGYPACEKIIDKVNSLKKPLLLYNCGANRLAFGLLTWQKHALGNSQFWWGAATLGNPTTDYADASCAVMNAKDGTVTDTTNWEQIREGVYDYRYIMTLEKAIADCPKPGCAEVSTAKSLLSQMSTFKVASGSGTGFEADFMAEALKNFKGDKLDEFRYKMAKCIVALQAIK